MGNKLVRIVKIKKSTPIEKVEVSESFTFNPAKKRIGFYLDESFPHLDKHAKAKHRDTLQSIYDCTNGLHLIETDYYRLTVEISNME